MLLRTQSDLKRRQLDDIARGPAPINPFKLFRESRGLTIAELSRLAHIDEMALVRSERGTYTEPLPSLVKYWLKQDAHISLVDINSDYEEFVKKQRERHKFYFGRSLVVNTQPEAEHPFRQLRARRPSKHDGSVLPVGLVECSQALCVPLDTIQFFEKKLTQLTVPKTIKVALNQVGYSNEQIREFSSAYDMWRSAKATILNSRFK